MSSYAQTPVYKEEVAANKVLYRGFGTQKPGGMLRNFMDIRDKPVGCLHTILLCQYYCIILILSSLRKE